VATFYADGSAFIGDTAGAYAFLGASVLVTVATGNHILVNGSAGLGSTVAGGATLARLSACHQPSAGGALVDNNGDWISNVRIAENTRIPMVVSQRISGLAPGTYNVGLCYQATAAQVPNWNNNDWATLIVLVTQN
jgi:hypothetical protein